MKRKHVTITLFFCSVLLSYCSPNNAVEQSSADSESSTDTPVPESSLETTSTQSPTDTPVIEFSLETANIVPPDDILEEITYYAVPAIVTWPDPSPLCALANGEPVNKNSIPKILGDPIDTEIMYSNLMKTSGWSCAEELDGKITYPNGRTKLTQLLGPSAYLHFQPSFNDPEGIYIFEISNGLITLKSNAYYRYPDVPRMYEFNDHQLVFMSFSPNETLRLFMYTTEDPEVPWKFVAWQEIKVDESGFFLLDATINNYCFVAITSSGIQYSTKTIGLILKDGQLSDVSLPNQYRRCPNSVYTRINFQKTGSVSVKVVNQDGSSVKLYANPRTNSRVRLEVEQDTILEVKGEFWSDGTYHPTCYDGKVWWPAKLYDENDRVIGSGYVIEYDEYGKYYLEPIDN